MGFSGFGKKFLGARIGRWGVTVLWHGAGFHPLEGFVFAVLEDFWGTPGIGFVKGFEFFGKSDHFKATFFIPITEVKDQIRFGGDGLRVGVGGA